MSRFGPLTALLLLGACDELDHPSHVHDLRLLAIAAEPPEVILDPSTVAVPEIEVRPLIADPVGGGRPVTFSVRACGNDPFAPSAPGAGTEGASNYPAGGARSTVGSARCPPDGPTSWSLAPDVAAGGSVRVTFTPEQIAAAFAADLFPGHLGQLHGGFDLGLPIALELTARAGSETAVGIKRVIFWPAPLRPDHRPNRNPRIGTVRLFFERDPISLDPAGLVEQLPPDSPRAVIADQTFWLEPTEVEAEPYVTAVIDRYTDQVRTQDVSAETLRYAFFATAGKFEPAETGSDRPFGAAAAERPHVESKYLPPPAAELAAGPLEVTVWIVVRDERGGSSWVERRLLVHPATDQ
jgi:hypothetical protein